MTYADKLKDPRWQKKRLEILSYADFRCQLCGDKTSTLHVHHSYYSKGKNPWQYPNGSMIALCEKHHSWYHEGVKSERILPAQEPPPVALALPKAPSEDLPREEVADFIAAMRRQLLSEA